MKILALEFSSERRSVAVAAGDSAAFCLLGQAAVSGTRQTPALSLIESALRQARLEREAIECLAVGLGPGSYTGIRLGISLAQGWQFARGVRLLGLSSLDSLAAQAHAEGWRGPVTLAIDAQRQEFCLATYQLGDAGPLPTEPPRLAALEELKRRLAAGEIVAGPEVRQVFAAGRELFPSAATLVRLAAARTDFVDGEKLEPIYLRQTNFLKAPPPRRLS